jgi:hypothetical protein
MPEEPIYTYVLLGILLLIIGIVLYERFGTVYEGFTPMGDSKFWARLVPRRGDVGPEQEQGGYRCDGRYFKDYADVQRFAAKTDWCRMVQRQDAPDEKFFACALGGTENLSAIAYRTPSVKDGFVLGRDDYMRDIAGEGRDAYCRIVKEGQEFVAECNQALETRFSANLTPDPNPPVEIQTLLRFYQGVAFWLRLRDDMVDYAQNLYVNTAGDARVDEETPRPATTRGLELNGIDQFVRIGDDSYLSFGNTVALRSIRAFHLWVKFDEFTNNAHVFDFGNGAGIDNVWLGILFRGNQGADADANARPLLCGNAERATVPEAPSGAQPAHEISPQELMKSTAANVEEFTCDGFAVAPVVKRRGKTKRAQLQPAVTADMIYEIWDRSQRKMRIKVPQMFVKGKWTHVVITATNNDAFRPDIAVYKNGQQMYVEPSGWLPQNNETSKNYIGKSNWENDTSQYANRDELFKGAVFDFRAYKRNVGDAFVKESFEWGKKMLGLES